MADSVPAIKHDLLSSIRGELGLCPSELIVSEYDVYMTLVKLKVNKASLDDCISNKLLKALADVLAAPICALVNTSILQSDKELSQLSGRCPGYRRFPSVYQLLILRMTLGQLL